MTKVLVEYYPTYRKGERGELDNQLVTEDSRASRLEIVNEHDDFECYGDLNDFIEGKTNTVSIEFDNDDWDEPTGMDIVITTYEDKRQEIESNYQKEMEWLNKAFGKEQ